MSRDLAQLGAEYEALIQFLYLAPVGLVQADIHGEIGMMNPVSAQLLMPLSRDGGLDNLFVALQDVAPELRTLCRDFGAPSGKVWDAQNIGGALAGREVSRHLRESGLPTRGPAPFGARQRSRFLESLDAVIAAVSRPAAPAIRTLPDFFS